MGQRTLDTFDKSSESDSGSGSSGGNPGTGSNFSGVYQSVSPEREFSYLAWQTYNETYKDETHDPHPMFTRLRTDRPKHVAMQIYSGILNGHSLTESVATAGIDFSRFEDRKWKNHPRLHRFEAVIRSYIWGKLRGIRFRSNIISELEDRPNTRRKLGYGSFDGDRRCPHQTTFNEAWNDRFSPKLRSFIEEVVALVQEWSYDNDRLIETTELLLPDERDES